MDREIELKEIDVFIKQQGVTRCLPGQADPMKKLVKLYLHVMADKEAAKRRQKAKERKMEAKKRRRITRSGSRWLTIADVCKRLGISRATFYRWRDAGQICPEQIGPHSVRIALSEVERFENSRPISGEWSAHG